MSVELHCEFTAALTSAGCSSSLPGPGRALPHFQPQPLSDSLRLSSLFSLLSSLFSLLSSLFSLLSSLFSLLSSLSLFHAGTESAVAFLRRLNHAAFPVSSMARKRECLMACTCVYMDSIYTRICIRTYMHIYTYAHTYMLLYVATYV